MEKYKNLKNSLKELLKRVLGISIDSLICYLSYSLLLINLTKIEISFFNWFGILIISSIIFKFNNNQ